ncbi:MAG: hypothetical protein JSU04_06265 [Bdellovibrionales bacterium]|nr:hypothetical protein [Bdellovibrionales bacterium]
MTVFKKLFIGACVAMIGSSALAQECSILASSRFKDELRETIRSELASQGVKVLFANEAGVNDYPTPFEEVPEYINERENFNYLLVMKGQELPKVFLGELYTSGSTGFYNQTTITEFTFGIAKIQGCRYKQTGEGACQAVLASKGLVYERVTAHSTRDLIVAGGELKNLDREKVPMEAIRAYLRSIAPQLCR